MTRTVVLVMAVIVVIAVSGLVVLFARSPLGGSSTTTGQSGAKVRIESMNVSEKSNVFANLLLQTEPSTIQTTGGQTFTLNLTVAFFRTLDEGVVQANATTIQGNLTVLTPGFVLDHVYLVGSKINFNPIIVAGDTSQKVTVQVTAPSSGYQGPLNFLLTVSAFQS